MRQLYDASGLVVANARYDPYGTVMSQTGAATSVYGFTGEQYDSYLKLLYLRARWYNDGNGRFTQPDPIAPDYADPSSLNRYNYVRANPVLLRDPSGLCDDCFVFYFPGLGYDGITSRTIPGEDYLLQKLRERTGVTTKVVYPYYPGEKGALDLAHTPLGDLQIPANGGSVAAVAFEKALLPRIKATEILYAMFGCRDWPATMDGRPPFKAKQVNFIGYSGGAQMAYSTAVELAGKVKVDNLVVFGSVFRAHSGVSNIGHLWDLIGEYDWFAPQQQSLLGADKWNNGWLLQATMRGRPTTYSYDERHDIYRNGATKCTFFNGPEIFNHFGWWGPIRTPRR